MTFQFLDGPWIGGAWWDKKSMSVAEILDAWWRSADPPRIGELGFVEHRMAQQSREGGDCRLREADDQSENVQVLSANTPEVRIFSPDTTAAVGCGSNEALSTMVSRDLDLDRQ